MPQAKPLSKEQILAAMSQTLSNKAAARYLHVSIRIIKNGLKPMMRQKKVIKFI
jgi:DNA-binding NarL/FixJ family response regulator